MEKESPALCTKETMMVEDQHVSLERRPSQINRERTVDTEVHQPPDQTHRRRRGERIAATIEKCVEIQRVVDDFHQQAEKEQNDDHMVVQGVS